MRYVEAFVALASSDFAKNRGVLRSAARTAPGPPHCLVSTPNGA